MRYFLDTEFNGFGGALISLALVSENGASLYLVYGAPEAPDPFVRDLVQPRLESVPAEVAIRYVSRAEGAHAIGAFLSGDQDPEIIADWPDDIRLCCQALMISPNVMADVGDLRFAIHLGGAQPKRLEGGVRHNAWWDAMALRRRFAPEAAHERRDGVARLAHNSEQTPA